MTGELLLLLLVVVLAAGLLTPFGRRLVGTTLDLIDGSLLVYGIRQSLGLDTTTRRQRRIARRRAAEQAELERRIGVGAPATAPAPMAARPTRLVASGEPASAMTPAVAASPAATSTAPATGRGSFRAPRLGRRQHLLDVSAALGIIVVAIVALDVLRSPAGGVLGATGAPDLPTPVPSVAASPSAEPSPSGP